MKPLGTGEEPAESVPFTIAQPPLPPTCEPVITARPLERRWIPPGFSEHLPHGVLAIGVGLTISGLAAYVFLAIASHELAPGQYAPLAAFWSLTFLLGPGSFGILERETSRRVAVGIEHGQGNQRGLHDIYLFGLIEVGVFVVLLASGHTTTSQSLFDGDSWLVLAAIIAVPSICMQYLAWGILAGNRSFTAYGTMNALEGLFRLAGGAALATLDVRTATEYGFVVALAPAVSVVFLLRALRRAERRGPPVRSSAGLRTSFWLLGASLAQAFLVNAGPLLVKLLASSSASVATGQFLSGLILVRIPLFLYTAASATLLPGLAGAASRQDWQAFRHQLDRLMAVIGLLGLATVLLASTIGPRVLGLVFGQSYRLDRTTMIALAVATSILLVTTTLSVALTATGAVRFLFACWAAGVVVVFVPVVLVQGLFARVELGLIGGAGVAAVGMAVGIYRHDAPRHAPVTLLPGPIGP
jgi:O-antigen/teichoic acid export membrane protein